MKRLDQTFVFFVSIFTSVVSPAEYDINNWNKISFVRQFFFTGLKSDNPKGSFLDSAVQMFKSGDQKLSVIEQIRQEVQEGISKEETNIENDFLISKLYSFQNSIKYFQIEMLTMEAEEYLDKLIALKDDVFGEIIFFIGHTFENSTGFNESHIICLAPYSAIFMGISMEVERECKINKMAELDKCKLNLQQRIDFLKSVKTAAVITLNFALQLREEYMQTDYNGNYYITRDHLTDATTENYDETEKWISVDIWRVEIGRYEVMTKHARERTIDVVDKCLIRPLNDFLKNNSIHEIPNFIDKKTDYPITIQGQPCDSPCSKYLNTNYFWCGLKSYLGDWDYCSAPGHTRYGEECQSVCKLYGSYFQCKTTGGSWDYCSPHTSFKIDGLFWPDVKPAMIVMSSWLKPVCISPCSKQGSASYWCHVHYRGINWNYCSPSSDYDVTISGERCVTKCGWNTRSTGNTEKSCNTEAGWNFCAPVFGSNDRFGHINFRPGQQIPDDSNWYESYKFLSLYLQNENTYKSGDPV